MPEKRAATPPPSRRAPRRFTAPTSSLVEKACFVVMPISVPLHLLSRYRERADHFTKIYESLIKPAVEQAGLSPIGPSRTGTENIQAAIINDLQGADLVVADLSGLNPNVFLELGIRSALDRPVCLIWDGHDSLPFDSGTLNTHKYDSFPVYELNAEIERMATFIAATMSKSDGRNELWKFFGSASATLPVAELDPEDASIHAKLDRLSDLIERQNTGPRAIAERATEAQVAEAVGRVNAALAEAGASGVHGTRVGAICRSVLGDAYDDFLQGGSLSGALARAGLGIHTRQGGFFVLGGGLPPALAQAGDHVSSAVEDTGDPSQGGGS